MARDRDEDAERREKEQREIREDLTERYTQEIQAALDLRSNQEEAWLRWLKCYKSEPRSRSKTYPWEGASNLVVGLCPIYVDSIVARIMQGVFQIEPHWVTKPLNKEAEQFSKKIEKYLDWCRVNMWDQYRAVKPMVLEMVKLGTGIITSSWIEDEYRKFDARTGMHQVSGVTRGPRSRWVPREDFLIAPGFTCINESEDGPKAPWVAHRQWFSRQQIEKYLYQGFFSLSEEDREKLFSQHDDETELREWRRMNDNQEGDTGTEGLYAIWQCWFTEDLDGDGYPEDHVACFHAGAKLMPRYHGNPYLAGMRPYVKAAFVEQEGQFDGQGVPEMVEMYQEELSTMHNQRRDNAHIAQTSMFAVRKGSGITERTKTFPGKFFMVTDPNTDIKELRLGQSYAFSMQEEQVTIGLAERRVGISDVNLGRESSPLGRAAATTVMALLQEGSRRFDLNTAELRRALSDQGLQIIELFQTHGMPDPPVAGSPEQVLGPEEGAVVREVFSRADDIRGMVGLQLNVATAAVNREVEKQATLQLFQYVVQYAERMFQLAQTAMQSQHPMMIQMATRIAQGADKLMERIFQSHQVFDLDTILVGDVLAGMAQPPGLPAPQMGGAPEEMPAEQPQPMPMRGGNGMMQ